MQTNQSKVAASQSIKLADFKDLTLETAVPVTLFFVQKFHVGSLKLTTEFPSKGLYTKDGARSVAVNLSEDEGRSFVVVYDHCGKPVSVYHRGELIL